MCWVPTLTRRWVKPNVILHSFSIMDASQSTDDSVDEDISISMCTERIMRAFDYDHPRCVEKALKHLNDHEPIPRLTLSTARQSIDTRSLLSLTLTLAPTPTGQTYMAAFIMSCNSGDELVQLANSLFWELFVPGTLVKNHSSNLVQ